MMTADKLINDDYLVILFCLILIGKIKPPFIVAF